MKTINKINILLFLVSITFFSNAQETNEQKRVNAEKHTAPFKIDYFSINKQSFYVLETQVINNKIVSDSLTKIIEVAGKLPYSSGNFKVSILDENGEILQTLSMADPLEIRSCEEGKNHIRQIGKGKIYIPLPKSSKITRLVFTKDKDTVGKIDIATLIEEMNIRDENKK